MLCALSENASSEMAKILGDENVKVYATCHIFNDIESTMYSLAKQFDALEYKGFPQHGDPVLIESPCGTIYVVLGNGKSFSVGSSEWLTISEVNLKYA